MPSYLGLGSYLGRFPIRSDAVLVDPGLVGVVEGEVPFLGGGGVLALGEAPGRMLVMGGDLVVLMPCLRAGPFQIAFRHRQTASGRTFRLSSPGCLDCGPGTAPYRGSK